jgi:hypothetical protein
MIMYVHSVSAQTHVPRPRGRRTLIAAAWLLALLGLFGMHALGTHGTASHQGAASHHRMTHSMTDQSVILIDPLRPSASPDMHGAGGGVLGLCMAVLGGVLLSLILRLRNRRRELCLTARRPTLALRVVIRRERDPPNLVRLSVMRC